MTHPSARSLLLPTLASTATVLGLLAWGCDTEEDAPAECSNGPRYEPTASFPNGESPQEALAECTPHCGENARIDGFYNVSALPSGECSNVGDACDMGAFAYCPSGERGGINHYRCTCTSNGWSCLNVVAGARGCASDADGGDGG